MGPRNRFQGMNFASLCSLAGRYDNHLPPQFLAPIDSLKIPAQVFWPEPDLRLPPSLLSLSHSRLMLLVRRKPPLIHWPLLFNVNKRARIRKRLRNPGIDSASLCTVASFVVPARQAGNRFLGSLKGLQIRALVPSHLDSCACARALLVTKDRRYLFATPWVEGFTSRWQ